MATGTLHQMGLAGREQPTHLENTPQRTIDLWRYSAAALRLHRTHRCVCPTTSPPRPLPRAESLDGLNTVHACGRPGLYTATYSPPTATLPVDFAWDNDDTGPTAAYSWTVPGTYTLTVTATNPCGTTAASLTVEVQPFRIYLPFVLKGVEGLKMTDP